MNEETLSFGLTGKQIEQIKIVFSQFPVIKKIWIFGSRARGDYKRNSDIDLAYEADNFSLDDELSLRASLSGLLIPYKIDLVNLNNLKEEAFKKKVDSEKTGF